MICRSLHACLLLFLPVIPILLGGCAGEGRHANPMAAPAEAIVDLVARGEYLVRVAGCNDCHTPGYAENQGNVPREQWLVGSAPLGYSGPWGTTYASNLRLRMQDLGHECFYCVFLDAQNRVIAAEELFRGTLTQTSVYPREVVKHALAWNAAAVILAHNHPSGVAEPSLQDQALTRTLAESLALVDVKVLDHFIVAPGACLSFAERGLL